MPTEQKVALVETAWESCSLNRAHDSIIGSFNRLDLQGLSVYDGNRPQGEARGIVTLIESKPMLSHVPDPSLISTNTRGSDATLFPNLRCATRADDGTWAFVYSIRGEVVRVLMSVLADGRAHGSWYNPRNGCWHCDGADRAEKCAFEAGIPSGTGALDRYHNPPGEPADGNDWVLVIEVEKDEE